MALSLTRFRKMLERAAKGALRVANRRRAAGAGATRPSLTLRASNRKKY